MLWQTVLSNRTEQNLAFDLLHKAVIIHVQLENGGVQGSGSIISEKGAVLTADHLFHEKNIIGVTAESYGGRTARCSIIQRNPSEDLAIIQCDRLAGLPYVRHINDVAIGERVIVIGSPGMGSILLNTGIISGKVPEMAKLLVDAMAGPGMSGGPVFNFKGEQVGIVQAILPRPPFVMVSTNSEMLRSMLKAARNKI